MAAETNNDAVSCTVISVIRWLSMSLMDVVAHLNDSLLVGDEMLPPIFQWHLLRHQFLFAKKMQYHYVDHEILSYMLPSSSSFDQFFCHQRQCRQRQKSNANIHFLEKKVNYLLVKYFLNFVKDKIFFCNFVGKVF